MRDCDGWTIDDDTLRPVLLDRDRVTAALATANPLDRLFLLGLLDRTDEALAAAGPLLAEAGADRAADPWRLLLLTGELHRFRGELDVCARWQDRAWRHARSRSRQATTLLHMGARLFDRGDRVGAAIRFELARTQRQGFAGAAELACSERALQAARRDPVWDAIVLAGGAGVRLGGQRLGAKALIPLAGWPLADHVLLAVSAASTRLQVGPARIALGQPQFCLEQPAGGGPVAGIAAALPLTTAPLVAVLAGDLPFIAGALPALLAAIRAGRHDAAALVDLAGRTNYLAAVWRTDALAAAVRRIGSVAGAPVRRLYEGADVQLVPDFDACSADVDTPADLRRADERIRAHSPEQLPAAPLAWPRLELHAPS